MNTLQARNAIRAFYHTNITLGVQPAPFYTQFDNQPLTDNNGNPVSVPTTSNKVLFSINVVDSKQVQVGGVGANTHRHVGACIAQVFVPVDKNDVDAMKIGQFISDVFLSKIVSGTGGEVRFNTPRIRVVGRDGSWWQVNVICPFHFDQIG